MALTNAHIKAIQQFLDDKGLLLEQYITGEWDKITQEVYQGYLRAQGVAAHLIHMPVLSWEAVHDHVKAWFEGAKTAVETEVNKLEGHSTPAAAETAPAPAAVVVQLTPTQAAATAETPVADITGPAADEADKQEEDKAGEQGEKTDLTEGAQDQQEPNAEALGEKAEPVQETPVQEQNESSVTAEEAPAQVTEETPAAEGAATEQTEAPQDSTQETTEKKD